MAKIDDQVLETTNTTGTGTFSLAGPPGGSAYRSFVAAFSTGASVWYYARRADNTVWEIGYGTITDGSPDTLTRNLVKSSSGALINWAAGDTPIYVYSFPSCVLLNGALNHFRGTTAPAYAEAGWLWEDTSGGVTATLLKIYDGTDWIVLGTINETANTFLPYLLFADNSTIATGTDVAYPIHSAGAAANFQYQGKQAVPILADSFTPRTTNGAARGSRELSTNKKMVKTLDFDATTAEYAQFTMPMPKEWNLGTVTFVPHWTAASGSGGVTWKLSAVAISNDDALDVAQGTPQSSVDTMLTANDEMAGPESSAITVAGTPAAHDLVCFEISRDPADGSDTLAVDAQLLGIMLFITTNAKNSA